MVCHRLDERNVCTFESLPKNWAAIRGDGILTMKVEKCSPAKHKMNKTKHHFDQLLELANRYPSPHNGQPIRVKIRNAHELDLYFQRERGLRAADISYIFSFVGMGVFMEHLALCAQALGHQLTYKLSLPTEVNLHGEGLVRFAHCSLVWQAHSTQPSLEKALLARQTSRKKYSAGVDAKTSQALCTIAGEHHMQLEKVTPQQAQQTIWLNQRAVFDDMFDDAVRRELDRWLRYTAGQKQTARDGLAYDCMEINGHLMRFIVKHYKMLHMPIIAPLLRQYYLRTMKDKSDVFYMLAPFGNEQASFQVGEVIMKLWQALTQQGYYLHPFGTIMSNHAAHRDFVQLTGISNESRESSYLVFIFRAGKSQKPTPSLRLPVKGHLLMESTDV